MKKFWSYTYTAIVSLANKPSRLLGVFALEILVSGEIYSNIEKSKGFVEGVWWALVTASTVGYGDQYPTTIGGRVLACILMYSMIFLVIPIITAQFASALIVDRDKWSHEEQEELKSTLKSTSLELHLALESVNKAREEISWAVEMITAISHKVDDVIEDESVDNVIMYDIVEKLKDLDDELDLLHPTQESK